MQQQAYVGSAGLDEPSRFGAALVIDADKLAVGVVDDTFDNSQGAVHVFRIDDAAGVEPGLGNISAIGRAGETEPFTACTILGRPGVELIVLAEAFGGSGLDPVLYLAPLTVPVEEVRDSALALSNDDFGSGVVPVVNRPLDAPTDSALITGDTQATAYCAHVFAAPNNGAGLVSIQFGDGALF